VSGREALLRRRENAPAAASVTGECVATHRIADGDALTLRSDALDFRTEERGGGKSVVHVVETDRPVRIESGGSEVDGTGLLAELDAGRRSGARRVARLQRDVQGVLRVRTDRRAADGQPQEVHVRCSGAGEIEALDRPSRDGRQPWRATFRDDVEFRDPQSAMTAELVVVEFVRTGTNDRAAGAGSTEVRSLHAEGDVRIDSTAEAASWHVECARFRRFAEDALTDVTILEGDPVLRWEGRAQSAAAGTPKAAPLSLYEIRCKGPVTMRARRTAAAQDAPADVTLVFEGDVVATERRADTKDLRSEIRAPRVTVESNRGATGRIDPRLVRAEQGAQARFVDFSARAQTITAVAAQPGGTQRIALVGSPVATLRVREGANPLGGTEPAGLLRLASAGRIDADIAPEPPAGTQPKGTRAFLRTSGGLDARKTKDDEQDWSWRLAAGDGDVKIGWDGAIEEMHAVGDARLSGRGEDGRTAELTGDRMTLRRRAAGTTDASADAWKLLDARVESEGGRLSAAQLTEAADDTRRNELRAREITSTEGGAVLTARGTASARLHRSSTGAGALEITASEIRADVDPDAEGPARVRKVTATGGVLLRDAMHRVTGERLTYDMARGEAEATGSPARLVRREDKVFESYAAGPVVRAWFDAKSEGADRFRRATLPSGGEIVAYFAAPARQRVTTTTKGPIELDRASASCVGQVVCVYESRQPSDRWNADARIDCRRLDMTFDPTIEGGRMSEKLRTLTATGSYDDPARVRTRDALGGREAYAEAERVEGTQRDTRLRLLCPSDRSTVYLHDISTGRRMRCDSAVFDYVTFEWTDLLRPREVE
jgi:hypothetical protein